MAFLAGLCFFGTILFGIAAFILLILTVAADDDGTLLLVTLAAVAIACLLGFSTNKIYESNTTAVTEVVTMEVTKMDIESVKSTHGSPRKYCYITVGDEYLIEVDVEDYVSLNIGDEVVVEITTETSFGETNPPRAELIKE